MRLHDRFGNEREVTLTLPAPAARVSLARQPRRVALSGDAAEKLAALPSADAKLDALLAWLQDNFPEFGRLKPAEQIAKAAELREVLTGAHGVELDRISRAGATPLLLSLFAGRNAIERSAEMLRRTRAGFARLPWSAQHEQAVVFARENANRIV
jgi:hypothetical protein